MKKLLSLLSVLTISGSVVPTTIAASPYQKEETKLENIADNKKFNTNNLENLNRNKRENKNNIFGIIKSIIIFNDESVDFSDFGIIVKLNNIIYCFKNDKVYEYNSATNKQKFLFSTIGVIEFVIALNNKLYFSSNYENIYEYNLTTKQQKLLFKNTYGGIIFAVVLNNKIYFGIRTGEVYEYDLTTKQQKVLKIKDGINTGVVLNNKLYFGSNDGGFYEYNPATKQQKLIFKISNIKSGIVLNNKAYFYSDFNATIYEYNPATNELKILIITTGHFNFKFGFILNDKIYFGLWDSKVYEYDLTTKQKKVLKIKDGINNGVVLNNKLYFFNKNFYEFEPLELVESDIINLQEQIRRGIHLYYQEQNPNSYVKNIEFNMNDLKYSDIELIKEEELPMQKITEDICVGETEFENSLSTEQKFKAQSCKYTKQKINSIQIIKGINKRVDNTLESGKSSTDTTSTTNTNAKTISVNVGAEVSAGWGPFSASVSTSVGSEESNISQIENSESKTKNISKIISNSSSFDLSNLKEEQEIITNELEYPSQEITVGGNQNIKVIFNLNKIIKKYKVTFKQNINGKIKAKIKNENDQIIEQEFSIKDIMLSLKENNILPKEIIINNNLVSFIGELIVSKNSFKLKVKIEEIDAI